MSASKQRRLTKQKAACDMWCVSEDNPTCPDCGERLSSISGVRTHYAHKHEEPYPWRVAIECDYCGEEMRRSQSEVSDSSNYCSESCSAKAQHEKEKHERLKEPVTFSLEGYNGYACWTRTGNSVCVHQLIAIANGADPEKVFGRNGYSVDHKNGCKLDNRPENIELLTIEEHGRKDSKRGHNSGHTHKEVLEIVEDVVHATLQMNCPGEDNE